MGGWARLVITAVAAAVPTALLTTRGKVTAGHTFLHVHPEGC